MADLRMEVTGLPELRRVLRGLNDPRKILPAFERAAFRIPAYLLVYPPTSWDGRTGNLGREWDVRATVKGNDVSAEWESGMDYAAWVLSQKMQAGVHRGRWRTDEEALDHIRPYLLDDLVKAIEG